MSVDEGVFLHVHDDADAGFEEVSQGNPLPVTVKGVLGRSVEGFLGKYIVTQSTFILKIGAGILHGITINTPLANAVMTVYDDVSAVAANKIAVITLPGTLLNEGPMTGLYDVQFQRGLTIVTSGANGDWTVAYL